MEDIGAADTLEMPAETNAIPKPVVSVIVPVYNVEAYLRRCVDSLLTQTLKEIEIILVDDGSTDRCGWICDEYARQDDRIRVIHQKNAGLSEARNAGIDLAEADYLMFADSDDWVEPDFCRTPLIIARERQADLVMFQYRRFRNGRERKRRRSKAEGMKTAEAALQFLPSYGGMAAWDKLYHRSLFLQNRYPKGKFSEDTFLTPVLIHKARRIVYSSSVLYNYSFRKDSLSDARSEEKLRDWREAHLSMVRRLKDWGFEPAAEAWYQRFAIRDAFLSRSHPETHEDCVRYLRGLKRCPRDFSAIEKTGFCLFRLSPGLFVQLCKIYLRLRYL